MGKPITDIKRYTVTKEEKMESDLAEVKEAVAENKDAILKGIELLKALDEGGTLDTAQSFTNAKRTALERFVQEISKEQYTPLLENLPGLIFLVGELDVKGLRDLTTRLNQGIKEMERVPEDKKANIFEVFKALKDPNVNRSLTLLLGFLKGMGKN
ncbi:DUF1641 domain-containing protein [Halobacillus litoralis]|uniref:DUF1641 domain-containing protein n=1 Tax=Halobacillus litoralis TaxID=45668 RepID=UPI001CD368E3|nr:DUF1641 domain-containing protein [Halobacillus litoralis]MCA0969512.1 DUF1641 domain-containing protein [Halobacillus litoralis]